MELESSVKFLFSNDFALFAQIEGGKHIRVSEVNSKKEYNYLINSESGSTNVAEIGKITSNGKNVVAIADDQGAIRLYDFKSKSLEAELNEHVTRVLSLRFQEETNSLFSVSADKKILKWDLTSLTAVESYDIDRKVTASEIKLDFIRDDISLLVSLDNKIVLYNTELKKVEKRFKGHPTHVHLLKSAQDSKYFASCSNEDAVYIWSIENEIPLLSLPILSQVFLNLDIQKTAKGHFLVLVSSTSAIRLWFLRATKSELQVKSSVQIPFQDRDLLQARIYDKTSLILSVFEENKPKFHIIPIFDGPTDLKDEDEIVQSINTALNQGGQVAAGSGKKSKKGKTSEPHVVGENDENVLNQYNGVKAGSKKNSAADKTGDGFLLLNSLKPNEVALQPEGMDSLAVVLTQALQNNDTHLLDYCFDNEDEDLIENTIQKLSPNKVSALLDKITERVDSGKRANYYLFAWLNYLVKHHAAFLIKSADTPKKIGPIIALLQKRSLPIDQIHKLKGKIDMVLDVENDIRRQKKSQKKLKIQQRPLVVYEEGELQETAQPAKGQKALKGYTRAMEELEDLEDEVEEKEFDDSVVDSEEDVDGEFDAYLQGDGEDYEEGEDDGGISDEDYIDLE